METTYFAWHLPALLGKVSKMQIMPTNYGP